MLKSVYQNPENGFRSERALDRDDIRRLVGTCTDRLLHDHKPLLETIRLQAHWLCHYGTWEDMITDHRHQLDSKLGSLTRMVSHLLFSFSSILSEIMEYLIFIGKGEGVR